VTSDAAKGHARGTSETLAELVNESGNSDAKRTRKGDAGWLPPGGALHCRAESGQLAFTTDERHTREAYGGLGDTCVVRVGADEVEPQAPVHPDNTLNELSGEEWLYFTKSLWTTAYPSELGHAARKAHGANKPPRLMAKLIEFFTKPGELVLDPFAGVGGTLLGAAVCRSPRRALGFEIEPRWAEVYESVARDALAAQDGKAAVLADLGTSDPGGARGFDPSGSRMVVGDAVGLLSELEAGSVDFVATDPPYNPQLRLTMAGGKLAVQFANRRTDYAMVTTDPADLANSATYAEYLDRMEGVLGELRRVLRDRRYATIIVRDAYQDGRYRFTGADLAARAERVGFVTKGDLVWYQAGARLRPYGYPRGFVPNIVHQHILVLRAG
jgi:DNA modification methylase